MEDVDYIKMNCNERGGRENNVKILILVVVGMNRKAGNGHWPVAV